MIFWIILNLRVNSVSSWKINIIARWGDFKIKINTHFAGKCTICIKYNKFSFEKPQRNFMLLAVLFTFPLIPVGVQVAPLLLKGLDRHASSLGLHNDPEVLILQGWKTETQRR